MTAQELDELCCCAEEETRRLCRADEYLAFNTAALCLAAFNTPQSFPKTPEEAFPKTRGDWRDAKNEMEKIARRQNFGEPRTGKEKL